MRKYICAVAVLIHLLAWNVFSKTVYVKTDGTGNGTSWDDAFGGEFLQTAITNAGLGDNIWVAKGTYKPNSWPSGGSEQREKHFSFKNGVEIYGGFLGTETDLNERDFRLNETILSGDIGIENDSTDNCFHVIYNSENTNLDNSSLIDGVTITQGFANAPPVPPLYENQRGGGIYNNGSARIINCKIINNSAGIGGGIFNYGSPEIINCKIINNSASSGGGFYTSNNSIIEAIPTIMNSEITLNYAKYDGGGIYINSSLKIINNTITQNIAERRGGGIYNYDTNVSDTLHLNFCTIASNQGVAGSQLYFDSDSHNVKYFNNTIIWNYNLDSIIGYNIFYPNVDKVTYCAITNGFEGEGNINLSINNAGDVNSPYFTDPANNDYSLQYNSACKDMAIYRYKTDEDILGSVRPQGAAYDMGAYEFITGEPNAVPPVIAAGSADSITVSSAVCHTDIITDGGIPLWQRGVKVSTQDGFDPVTEGFLYTLKGDYTGTEYSNTVTALVPDSVYYYVPYAENRMGYAFGSDQGTFKTLNLIPDVVGIVYVKQDGTGNGSSWDNALNRNDLQAAIYADSVKQVWVAKGTYYPTSWPSAEYYELEDIDFDYTERTKHFSMKKGVELIGGFAGDETTYEQRDYKLNETTLSGDTGIEKDITDNIYTIIVNFAAEYLIDNEFYYYPDIDSTAVIDGFTIRDCNNDDDGYYNWREGGGMLNRYVGVKIKNCSFLNNFCNSSGEAVYCMQYWDYFRPIIIDNSIFKNNSSSNGLGALYFYLCDDILIKNSAFLDNSGNVIWSDSSNPVIKNCLFSGNDGTAISSYSRLTLINSTIVNNNGGLQFGWQNALTNNVIFNNVYDIKKTYKGKPDELPVINNCATSEIIDFEYTGSNNIIISQNNSGDSNSPYFSDPENNNWMIQEHSPLRNAGILTADVPLYDIMGYLRDSQPDIGCYEYDPTSIEENDNVLPLTTELYQNYPNPFNPATNIKFSLSKTGKVEFSVFNITGQLVRKVLDKEMTAGNHAVKFEADDLNSGMYFYKLKANGKELTKKMLMVK